MLSKILPPTDETTEDRRKAPTAGHSRRLHQRALTVDAVVRASWVSGPLCGVGRRTRPSSGQSPRTDSGIRAEEGKCYRRSSRQPTRRPRIGAKRRPQVTRAALPPSNLDHCSDNRSVLEIRVSLRRREANPRGLGGAEDAWRGFEPRRNDVLEDPSADRRANRGSAGYRAERVGGVDHRLLPPPPLVAQFAQRLTGKRVTLGVSLGF